jgi:hypothetical protein
LAPNDERPLWRLERDDEILECVMVSCCSGAELQVRTVRLEGIEIVLRELYPSKSDLYERSRDLKRDFEGRSASGR